MRVRQLILPAVLLAALAGGGLMVRDYGRRHPENVPWTALDLRRPIGTFTGRKLNALGGDPALCRALLIEAGARFTALPARNDGPACSYDDAVRLPGGGALPGDIGAACPVAAALLVWEREIVQPAARRHFGRRVAAIDHYGSYSCRRLNSRAAGGWSEHARANALDLAGFRLAGGTRVTVAADWRDPGAKGRFLREVRDGACSLFATVLSPDYDEAHRDHFHLDQARRAGGWRACR
ncbi:MAG TPA: extensin family protein [Allosphingosinicella sp.]|nr:extensin family protein [Allosphingosinicella sp.]